MMKLMNMLLRTPLSIYAVNTPKDTILVCENMYLPNIDWEENTITGNQYKKVMNELLESTIDDVDRE
jgi:hypothetical protein